MKVLLFGLNYTNTNHSLNGCINDTVLIKNCLKKYVGIKDNSIVHLTDDTDIKPTKKNIIESINKSINELNSGKYKTLWIHFSGHGTYYRDTNGDETISNDGNKGRDEALYTLDDKIILDDELNKIFSQLNNDKKLICIFDCCHSGTALDLPYRFNYNENKIIDENVSGSNKIKCNAILLSGCKDKQYSADAYDISDKFTYTGAFSTALLNSLQKEYSVSLKNIIVNANKFLQERGFDQIPQVTCNYKNDIKIPFLVSKKRKRIIKRIKRLKEIVQKCSLYYSIYKNDAYLKIAERCKFILKKLYII